MYSFISILCKMITVRYKGLIYLLPIDDIWFPAYQQKTVEEPITASDMMEILSK